MDNEAEREFEQFVQANARRLLHAATLLTGDRGRGEDLVQNTLARTYLRWPRIRHDDPITYVRRGLVNGHRDWWRRKPSHEQPLAYPPDRPAPGDPATELVRRDAVVRALTDLTKRERAVVVLRYYEDLTEAEIAEVLGVAVGTVKSTANRALRKLRVSPQLAPTDLTEATS
ncbi:SigE family RNA polymerase sigma factor [Embleya sp. NBC_00896]|uniref:SigE family RNA polymerase sigma factor n=1 Tax=Embleya sp. NBC_00896 TaxID=2975961 RepID=UPI002F90D9E7|nr:SigE family RNA polymerase sigma factor [Embleya sp. NBC_00896]